MDPSTDEAHGEPVKDILEDSKAAAGQVLSYYQNMSRDVCASHPVLKIFKSTELDASMAQCQSGAYHTYWTMDKITDVNNTVDSTPDCPEVLKQVFAPGNSRNARIRANRIGKILFDTIAELKAGGGTGFSASASAADMGFVPSTAVAGEVTPQTQANAPNPRLLVGQSLVKYVFSPDLPPEAQLRVRDSPSMDGDVVGTVSQSDDIFGSSAVASGDYIRVQITGWPEEAWMLTTMGGQDLLVPTGGSAMSAPPVQAQSAPAEPTSTQAFFPPSAATSMSPKPTSARPASAGQSRMGQPMMSQSARGSSAMDPMMASQMMNMSMMQPQEMMSATLTGMEGQPVPYEMYRRLEQRVNRLEQELNTLKMCLRSI